ncbi:MAG: DUF4321 domain-containing protein [Nitrospirae bacterium]|nr:DUF4321 domain-containing protein [Nitrospirota bacterium]
MAVKKNLSWLLIFVFIGALLGGVLGEILRVVSPEGPVRDVFIQGFDLGLHPPVTLDLRIFSLTLGFTIKANLLTLLGSILGIYLYRQA